MAPNGHGSCATRKLHGQGDERKGCKRVLHFSLRWCLRVRRDFRGCGLKKAAPTWVSGDHASEGPQAGLWKWDLKKKKEKGEQRNQACKKKPNTDTFAWRIMSAPAGYIRRRRTVKKVGAAGTSTDR